MIRRLLIPLALAAIAASAWAQSISPPTTGGSGGGSPTGAAGGKLSGTYPNPGLNASCADLNNSTPACSQITLSPTAWTPIDSSGAGLTFSLVSANYVRMGNMVFAYGTLTYPGTADASAMIIGGLPITVANAGYAQQCSISWSNTSTLARLRTIQNTTTLRGYTSAGVAVTNATMSGLELDFLCIYPAS